MEIFNVTFIVVWDYWVTTEEANDVIIAIRVEVFNVASYVKVFESVFTLRTADVTWNGFICMHFLYVHFHVTLLENLATHRTLNLEGMT